MECDAERLSSRIEVSGVCVRAGHRALLQGVEFEAQAGTSMALVGHNGIGKTTLLRIVAGLSRPEAGRVAINGEEIWPEKKVSAEHFAVFLSSQPALLLDHSVVSNLEFYCNSYGFAPKASALHSALKSVGLDKREEQVARSLSTGQKRRLTLASFALLNPKILLVDEPTNGLDTEGVDLCLQLFKDHTDKGGILLAATHDAQLISHCTTTLSLNRFIPPPPSREKIAVKGFRL